jgi:VIT1/CCC1 family predicted Fe2+/Mn2+ transporter
MYRDAVDQATRNDIAAATAVHRELGRDYDDAVAESLVDRIGAEIDKRVDARLGARPSRSAAESWRSARSQALALGGAAAGAGLIGLIAVLTQNGANGATVKSVIWIWVVLAILGAGGALLRKVRGRG